MEKQKFAQFVAEEDEITVEQALKWIDDCERDGDSAEDIFVCSHDQGSIRRFKIASGDLTDLYVACESEAQECSPAHLYPHLQALRDALCNAFDDNTQVLCLCVEGKKPIPTCSAAITTRTILDTLANDPTAQIRALREVPDPTARSKFIKMYV